MSLKGVLIAVLLMLSACNGVWLLISGHAVPLIAVIAYAVVAFLVLRRNDFRAGFIIGIVGFAVHLLEVVIQGTVRLASLELVWLFANIALPLVIAGMSWILIQRSRYSGQRETKEELEKK